MLSSSNVGASSAGMRSHRDVSLFELADLAIGGGCQAAFTCLATCYPCQATLIIISKNLCDTIIIYASRIKYFKSFLCQRSNVWEVGSAPTTSASQALRAPNCATPSRMKEFQKFRNSFSNILFAGIIINRFPFNSKNIVAGFT